MKVKFTVAMDAEQKKLKNVETIEMDVDFEGVAPELIQKHAVANMVVQWQSQIRNNWTKFLEKGVPAKIFFGVPIYEGKTAVTLSPQQAIQALLDAGQTMEEIIAQYKPQVELEEEDV